MALTGNLKFVKTGPGTFVVKKDHQTFTGGTQVAAGTLKYAAEPAYWPLGGNGTTDVSAQLVTVDDGATLDVNGYGGFGYTTVVFNGGTVKGTTALFNCAKSLTTNSYLNVTGDFNMQYNGLVLNGHTLEIALANAKTLKFQDFTPQGPGKIKIISGGWLNTLTSACVATNVDFIVGCALNLGTALSVHDYEAVYNYNAANSGTAALNVYGTFKPSEHNYFYGCTMQDGSTIDLSARTNALPRVAAFTTDGDKTLKFANNATVKIKLGGRKVSRNEPIVSWTNPPDNIARLKFVSGDEDRSFSIIKKDDGLYIHTGTVIFVR
jgi:autotransporter-associated beta strand protein